MKVEPGQLRCWKHRDCELDGGRCFIIFKCDGKFVASHGRTMEFYWSIIANDKLMSGWPNSVIEHSSEVISERG